MGGRGPKKGVVWAGGRGCGWAGGWGGGGGGAEKGGGGGGGGSRLLLDKALAVHRESVGGLQDKAQPREGGGEKNEEVDVNRCGEGRHISKERSNDGSAAGGGWRMYGAILEEKEARTSNQKKGTGMGGGERNRHYRRTRSQRRLGAHDGSIHVSISGGEGARKKIEGKKRGRGEGGTFGTNVERVFNLRRLFAGNQVKRKSEGGEKERGKTYRAR